MPHTLRPALPVATLPLRPRRVATAAGLAALVLVLHAWLLGSLPPLPGFGGPGEQPRPLHVRQILRPLPPPAEAAPDPPAPAAPPAATAAVRARPGTPVAAEASASAAEPAAAPEAEALADAGGGAAVPVYATRLPPAATLLYAVQRDGGGGRAGLQAELRWRPDGDRYALTLGLAATGWASLGDLDNHGLAPERHVETRRGRELRAVNFQRERGLITFSGPQVTYALLPGAQDRLTWFVQLGAVVAANPALAAAGGEVTLFVAGPRGNAGLWTFAGSGHETTTLADDSSIDTVHLLREPPGPRDTRAEVWLDPARHHLPVRVRLQNRVDGQTTEFLLQSLSTP